MSIAGDKAVSLGARPEVELLLVCARTKMDDERAASLRVLLRQEIDWERLLRLALGHGVMPLLYHHVNEICPEAAPTGFMSRLRDHFYLNAARNHLLAQEMRELLEVFRAHAISAIPYKGPALALSLYGDTAFRQFSDLDLIVHREDVARASALLHLRGYERQHKLTRAQEAAFLRIECEHVFARPGGHIYLDLHWQFVPRYFSLKLEAEDVWKRLEEVSFDGTATLTFAPEDLLLILCVHASKEFWERLIWLCDISEILKAHRHLNWEEVVRRADASGARRMLLLSLLLARDLLGAEIPQKLLHSIEADPVAQRLAAHVKREMFSDAARPTGVSRYVRPVKAIERLHDRVKFCLRLAMTPTPEDWTFIRLPDPLLPLYYLTRPVRLAKKYMLTKG